jgi:hypothetical protein
LDEPLAEQQLAEYLRIPKQVLVGELDTEQDAHLRRSRLLTRTQGKHRIERARRFALTMRAQALRAKLPANCSFELLLGSGHSFRQCVRRGGLADRLARFLFELSVPSAQGAASPNSAECPPTRAVASETGP